MRTQQLIAASALAVVMLGTGCGIPEEQHNEALNKIKKLTADMKAEQKACSEAKNRLGKTNDALTAENQVMKTKLVSLGQNLSNLRTQAGQMVQNLSEKEKRIAELMKAQEAARRRAQMFRNLVARFKKMIDSGKLKVNVRNGRMVVQMSDKILFDSGKARLKKNGKAALEEVTKILVQVPGRNYQVAGHTDNVKMRSRRFRSNWELSAARAVNVVKFMIKKGMPDKRISAAGYAETDPVGDNSTKDGRQINRRIEITLMPSLDELPKISGM